MAGREEGRTTLATRIPKPLHRQLKLHCVEEGVLVMDFVVAAIEERLRKKGAERGGGRGSCREGCPPGQRRQAPTGSPYVRSPQGPRGGGPDAMGSIDAAADNPAPDSVAPHVVQTIRLHLLRRAA